MDCYKPAWQLSKWRRHGGNVGVAIALGGNWNTDWKTERKRRQSDVEGNGKG